METLSRLEGSSAGVSVARLETEEEVRGLLRLFAGIAEEQGWQPGGGLREVPRGAEHFALCADGCPVGGLQLVLPDAAGRLPCQEVWPDAALPEKAAHVTILALQAGRRGDPALFWSLCQALWCHCADRGIKSLVLEATPRMDVIYRRMGLPLRAIGGEREHWGEPCVLSCVDVVTVAGTVVLRARKSGMFRRLVLDALQTGG